MQPILEKASDAEGLAWAAGWAADGPKYWGHGVPPQLWTETGDWAVGVLGHGGIQENRHSKLMISPFLIGLEEQFSGTLKNLQWATRRKLRD